MPYTTFRKLRAHGACKDRYKFLRKALRGVKDTEPISLLTILDTNGLDDALWALQACDDERFACLFACAYAAHVLPIFERQYPNDKRPRNAIRVARRFASGKATREELASARAAAREVVWAAEEAAKAAERKWQEGTLRKMLAKYATITATTTGT